MMKTSKKEAEELVFADELKDLHISLDEELENENVVRAI